MKNTKGYPVYCSNCAGRIMAMLALLRLVNQIEEALDAWASQYVTADYVACFSLHTQVILAHTRVYPL